MTGSYPRVKFPPSIKKKRKSASKDKLDANYENEHKCDRAGLETIEPKSIKRIAYKILKKKLSANGEYEHKCAPRPRLKQLTLIAVSVLNLRIVRD